MSSTARRVSTKILWVVGTIVAMVASLLAGMLISMSFETESDPYFDSKEYVTVVHEDGTQTWEKVGTLCPAGQVETGKWVEDETKYKYSCD